MPPRTRNGRAKLESWNRWHSTEHYKYPETVGNDTRTDNISFNSHQSSEYAIKRMDRISETTHEPFMLFEMMTIDEVEAKAKLKHQVEFTQTMKNLVTGAIPQVEDPQTGDMVDADGIDVIETGKKLAGNLKDEITTFIKDSTTPAERNYTGSIALYMPTDIQVNDSMVYNEDTRKLGAALSAMAGADGDNSELFNWVTMTDPAVLATMGAAAGVIPGVPAALTAVISGSLGALVQTEMQRHVGKVMNPNELARYQSTALRTFTFNWTMLPDNENESDQVSGLIKFFRKSAHAKKTSSTLVTVPDHVVTSFHGAKDMIQLPPCFIESVNVTYNPNNSSFFRRNNSPVEVGLSVALKEIVPIYAADVERGY